jgi:hypothetical protein
VNPSTLPHDLRARVLFGPPHDRDSLHAVLAGTPIPPHRELAAIRDTLVAKAGAGEFLFASDMRALADAIDRIAEAVTPEPPRMTWWGGCGDDPRMAYDGAGLWAGDPRHHFPGLGLTC